MATDILVKEGLKYTASNRRLRYTPELHENHGKPWTVQELIYLCSSWDGMKKADIAAALGRTHSTVLTTANQLRKEGKFDYYKKLGE